MIDGGGRSDLVGDGCEEGGSDGDGLVGCT